jgi:predicted nucleic acid-binding protein
VADEVARYVPRLAAKRGLDASSMFAALSVMPVTWEPEASYAGERDEALRRIGERDATDWPTVALALTRSLPIWSQDRDMESSGLAVVTTGMLLDALDL